MKQVTWEFRSSSVVFTAYIQVIAVLHDVSSRTIGPVRKRSFLVSDGTSEHYKTKRQITKFFVGEC
jgi:hypothetical protein